MLNKKNRISNERLIIKLARKGEAKKTKNFVFKRFPSHLPDSKFAVSVSKKNVAKAVKRNKLKRQIYDSLRRKLNQIPSPIVCLIILKKGGPEKIEYNEIDNQVNQFINALK